MVIKGIGNLIVKRNQRAVGILTEREIHPALVLFIKKYQVNYWII